MDVGIHVLSGIILAYLFRDSTNWVLMILAADFPDLVGELLYQLGRLMNGKKIKIVYDQEVSHSSTYLGNSYYLVPYNFLHSIFPIILLFIFSVPMPYVLAYNIHIFLDVISHSRHTLGIMLFWPFSKKRFGPEKDWWYWRLLKGKRVFYFNLVLYLIVFLFF